MKISYKILLLVALMFLAFDCSCILHGIDGNDNKIILCLALVLTVFLFIFYFLFLSVGKATTKFNLKKGVAVKIIHKETKQKIDKDCYNYIFIIELNNNDLILLKEDENLIIDSKYMLDNERNWIILQP